MSLSKSYQKYPMKRRQKTPPLRNLSMMIGMSNDGDRLIRNFSCDHLPSYRGSYTSYLLSATWHYCKPSLFLFALWMVNISTCMQDVHSSPDLFAGSKKVLGLEKNGKKKKKKRRRIAIELDTSEKRNTKQKTKKKNQEIGNKIQKKECLSWKKKYIYIRKIERRTKEINQIQSEKQCPCKRILNTTPA